MLHKHVLLHCSKGTKKKICSIHFFEHLWLFLLRAHRAGRRGAGLGGGDGGHLAVPAVPAEPTHQTGLQDGLLLHLPSCYCGRSHRHLGCKYNPHSPSDEPTRQFGPASRNMCLNFEFSFKCGSNTKLLDRFLWTFLCEFVLAHETNVREIRR